MPPFDSKEVGFAGAIYVLFVGVYLPFVVWRAGRRARNRPAVPRKAYTVSTLLTHAFLGFLGLVVARVEWIALFPAPQFTWGDVVLALVTPVMLVIVMAPYRRALAQRNDRRLQLFCESTRDDRLRWTLISLSAGFWEEIVYRGVLPVLIARITGSVWLAVALAVVAFALGHLQRGFNLGTVLVGAIGLAMHCLVFLTGELYVAMATHFLYDVGAGFAYMRLAREHGIRRAPSAASDAPATG